MSDQAASRANPFWTFSLALYSAVEVQRACLELQDGCGVDVNVLLFTLYLASTGRRIGSAEARAVIDSLEPWRVDVVTPLRNARRNLKTPCAAVDANAAEALRAIVKKAELEAERLQQAALYRLSLDPSLGAPAQPAEAAAANVAAYGSALGRQLAAGPVGVMLAAVQAQLAPNLAPKLAKDQSTT